MKFVFFKSNVQAVSYFLLFILFSGPDSDLYVLSEKISGILVFFFLKTNSDFIFIIRIIPRYFIANLV